MRLILTARVLNTSSHHRRQRNGDGKKERMAAPLHTTTTFLTPTPRNESAVELIFSSCSVWLYRSTSIPSMMPGRLLMTENKMGAVPKSGNCRFVLATLSLFFLLDAIVGATASTGFHGPAVVNFPAASVESNREDLAGNATAAGSEDSIATIDNATTTAPPLAEWRRSLPVELQNKTKTLQRIVVPGSNGCRVEVYLLGTAHVSNDSSRDVRLLLDAVEPNVLFLELCDQRIPMMLTPPTPPKPTEDEMSQTKNVDEPKQSFWKRLASRNRESKTQQPTPEGSRSMYGVAAGLLTNMQQDYAQSLGVELGGEFRVAFNYWNEHRQQRIIHMILGDRPLYLTLTRAWQSLRLWGKTKLVVSLLISSLQKPDPEELREWMQKILSDDTGDLLTESIAELAKHFPALERVIIQERDTYMACKLYQTCRSLLQQQASSSNRYAKQQQQTSKVTKLVAIVGAGHVQGICRLLTGGRGRQPEEMLEPLIELKKPIPHEDRQILIFDVMEVNAELLQSMAEEMQASSP